MIDRNLEIFIRVAENMSLTKAARGLFITQPAVSNAIRKLETNLNVRLFHRHKRDSIRLTAVGEKILELSKQMAHLDNRIRQTAFEENNLIGGHLRVATLPTLTSAIISKTLKTFLELHPDVTVDIQEDSPNNVLKMVKNNHVDFALSCEPYHQFDSKPLIHDHLVAMLPPDSPKLDEVNIARPPGRLIVNQHAYDTILEYMPEDSPLDSSQFLFVEHPETAIQMASDGIGFAVVSEFTLDSLTVGHRRCPVIPHIGFEIGIFSHRLDDLTPVASAFMHEIQNTTTRFYSAFRAEH